MRCISVLIKVFYSNYIITILLVDISNFCQDVEIDKKKCYINQDVWWEAVSGHVHSNISSSRRTPEHTSRVFSCVSDAFHWIVGNRNVSTDDYPSLRGVISRVDHVQIFVTGSLYLVGMMLQLLEAEC